MQLQINGRKTVAQPGQTLLEIIQKLGMGGRNMTDRPIAAKIAGEVFNLNYIPVRITDACQERPSIRRAMAASGGKIQLLYYQDPAGKDVYSRTVQFVLFLALRQLWPKARTKMNCTVGSALFIEVMDADDFSVSELKAKVQKIVEENIPLCRRRITKQAAIEHFSAMGQLDKARLLQWREESFFDIYTYGDFSDYYYGELAPSTGYLQTWDILPTQGGF